MSRLSEAKNWVGPLVRNVLFTATVLGVALFAKTTPQEPTEESTEGTDTGQPTYASIAAGIQKLKSVVNPGGNPNLRSGFNQVQDGGSRGHKVITRGGGSS